MNFNDFKICLLTSILLALSFPPFPTGFLAPIALAIFLNHITKKEPKTAFRLGYFNGLLWAAFTLFWIATNTFAGAVLAIVITPLQYAFVWWIFNRIYHRNPSLALWTFPILWVAAEYLRHFSDLRFNWMNIAYTQTYYLPFIQFIEWTGYLGLALLIGYITVLLYLIIFKKQNLIRNLIIISVMIILPLSYGIFRMTNLENEDFPTLRVGVVQPNMDPFKKWDQQFQDSTFRILKNSTLKLAGADLVIWPETATPFYLRLKPYYLYQVHNIVDSLGIYLITGTPDIEFINKDDYKTFNSAFFFVPHQSKFESYNKIALVPAAESMPFKKAFPFLRKLDVGGGDFFSGSKFKIFSMEINKHQKVENVSMSDTLSSSEVKVATVICYDSVFPQLVRQFVKNGAHILTIITNDAWFGNTSGPYQHAQYAVFRAIENRVGIARSANTGISMFIDPTGRKHEVVKLQKRADIIYDLPVMQGLTFYTRYGDWLGTFCLILSILLILGVFLKKERILS